MTAVVAVIAILVAVLLIAWARIEVHGTEDLDAFIEEGRSVSPASPAENEAASSRWATGFSH